MDSTDKIDWDESFDLVVVGTGAGAMTTAIVAHDQGGRTLLIEKSDRYGGSSAMSGGGLWVPNNHLMAGVGIDDSPEEAWEYLSEITAGTVPKERLQAYIESSPELVKYLCDHTHLDFVSLPEYADYYPRAKGSKPGGRALEPKQFNGKVLGDDLLSLRDQNPQMLVIGRMFMTIFEARTMLTKAPGWIALTMKLALRYLFDIPWRFKSKRDRMLAMGNGLVGSLRRSILDRNIPLWLNTAAKELVVENGQVVGIVVEKEGRELRIRAEKGVVLAAGGFEGNQSMREKYLPNPTQVEWSCANKHNTGDAINMGLAVGASLDFMDGAWWGPCTVVPGEPHSRMLVIEKALPGSILVNKAGERFCNEAAPYIDVVNAMYDEHSVESPCVPCYLIFDSTFRTKYPVGPMLPGSNLPDWALPSQLREGYFHKSNTIQELARQAGLDGEGLQTSVDKINEYAKTGADLDYHRGETNFDTYYGDETVTPNPCLAPIAKPPFYSLEVVPGELGTKGGLKTDARARVLNQEGEVISGLYAIGNCSAAVMGPTYAGAGATLGPSTTFGYIAAKDAIGS